MTQNGTRRWDLCSKLVLSPDNTCGPVFLNDVTKPPTHAEDSQLALEGGWGGTGPAGRLPGTDLAKLVAHVPQLTLRVELQKQLVMADESTCGARMRECPRRVGSPSRTALSAPPMGSPSPHSPECPLSGESVLAQP